MASVPSLSEDLAASYRVSLRRTGQGPDATWLAEVDELPNVSARGATPEEAVRRVWAAASGVPEGDAGVAKTAPRHSGKLLVRMPATLHDELARAAESEGVSLNQLITGVLAGAVEWRATDAAPEGAAAGQGLWGRWTPIALAANFAVVLVAAIVAIAVLVVALRDGF
ncbi:MAG: toxin-antitoxin system HicB family antitoxin [Gaiellaceae bacterium]